MTAPMTHPLTPREKVAAVVLDAAAVYLIQQYGASHGLDHEVDRARIMSAIPNDAILTALASGSGDHAELAKRVAEGQRLQKGPYTSKGLYRHDEVAALLAENAALRAEGEARAKAHAKEIAGLYARVNEAERTLSEHRITADLLVSTLKADKAEAERKLAEAEAEVQRWKSAYDKAHEQATENGSAANALRGKLAEAVGHVTRLADWIEHEVGAELPYSEGEEDARTFLSKEAERG